MDLPPTIAPPPEMEAVGLALDKLIFEALEKDKAKRAEAGDEELQPLRAFLLLDASCDALIPFYAENFKEEARCLFDGSAFEDLGEVAPWLIEVERYGEAWDWYVENGWGRNWGVFLLTRLPMANVKRHLKKFLKIEDENGEVMFFKFYRPEHMRTYLPIFDDDQRESFLRGIDGIMTETEDGSAAIVHRVGQGARLDSVTVDLVKLGTPLLPQPPTEQEINAYIDEMLAEADQKG